MRTKTTDPVRTKFLLTALPDVLFDGWSDTLMDRTASKLGMDGIDADLLFPKGAHDLATYFLGWAADETAAAMGRMKLDKMRVRDRITLGVRTHIEILQPYKEAFAAAIRLLARGFSLPRRLWQGADAIWWAAGDTSTDHNHYTKRLLLSGVMATTTLYWLNDQSRDNKPTWGFLDRRIDNVMELDEKLRHLKKRT